MSRFVTNARHLLPAVVLAVALAGSVWLPQAEAAEGLPPGDYPSWEDVQQAKLTEAGTAKEIGRISGLLAGLQAQSEALGNAAVVSAAESAAADAALAASTARVEALAEQAGQANADLLRRRKDIGALAAQSYKTGELKIRELRRRAEQALGAKFDVRRFHDAVLGNGSVPLTVLEQVIDEFIAAEQKR